MNKTEFLQRAALQRKAIDVPDFGTVNIRQLSAAEVNAYVALQREGKSSELDLLAWIFARVVCDENGAAIFEEADLARVKEMPLTVLKPPAEAAVKFSGIDLGEAEKKTESAS